MSADDAERLCAARRILVVGPSGAGKTRLALALGEALALPVVHLDARRWREGWIALDEPEWRDVVRGLVEAPAWIMDGTYEGTLDLRVPAAEAVVVLEPPRPVYLAGLLARRLRVRDRPRADAPAGQRLDPRFLRYAWRYGSDTRPALRAALERDGGRALVIHLPSRRAGRKLVAKLAS